MNEPKDIIRKLLWKTLLVLSPSRYEKRKSWRMGMSYPDFFDATKSIFIHIPKAAGTSVSMALYGWQIYHESWRTWHELNPRKFEEYFKFAVVRDPVSRFVSAFDFLKRGGMNERDKKAAERLLKSFANANEFALALVDYDLQVKVLDWVHFRPQAYYIADDLGRSKMNLLIRFENIEAGYELVAKRLNCANKKLPHINKTLDRKEISLSQPALDILGCIYQKDFALWKKQAS